MYQCWCAWEVFSELVSSHTLPWDDLWGAMCCSKCNKAHSIHSFILIQSFILRNYIIITIKLGPWISGPSSKHIFTNFTVTVVHLVILSSKFLQSPVNNNFFNINSEKNKKESQNHESKWTLNGLMKLRQVTGNGNFALQKNLGYDIHINNSATMQHYHS